MNTPAVKVCVPYRADTPERARNFEHVHDWWTSTFDWPVSVADSDGPVFNRAQARNRAAAGDWTVAVFADADTVGQGTPVHRAVQRAHDTGQLAWPFDSFAGLSEKSTQLWVDRNQRTGLKVVKQKTEAPGGILAVHRSLFETVGGYDEGFVGWGYEDVAFIRACMTLGKCYRLAGKITHLWHPYDATRHRKDDHYRANRQRVERYRQAEGNPTRMRQLLTELDVTWPR